MTSRRLPLIAAVSAAFLAALAGGGTDASAQGFFERLFGLRPAPPPSYPPQPVPQRGPYGPAPGPIPGQGASIPGVPGAEGEPGLGPVAPPPPAPPKPIVLKAPTEDAVVGRELKLNGGGGSLKIERAGRDLRAQITLAGSKISDPTESCAVPLGDGQPVALASQGRVDGLPRYAAQAPACPIVFDVLDGAVMVTAPTQACTFQEADCKVEPAGMWGPEPNGLLPKAREIEEARGTADKAVRENYKALAHKVGPQSMRPVVAEQAAFSADRETMCRSYRREGAHGFCNARFTEGRAVVLAAKLGILPTTPEPTAAAPPQARRPPRQAAQPAPPQEFFPGAPSPGGMR
ncbi:MAG TPA: hypothetical protein VF744_19735 [Beijerinckiaceae bacterium]|jgi:hypothetical protein